MQRRALVIVALMAVIAAALLAHMPGPARAAASCSRPFRNTKVCRIDQPVVTAPATAYPDVTYQPGDTITVEAGGCVQTGGFGKTWKLYVNPQGDNSDRLYHGLIWLPGATSGMQRIGVSSQVFHVSSSISSKSTVLHLGYEDDQGQYGDNGYYSHDDGTGDQCKNVGNAYVVLTIVHNAQPIVLPSPLPLDLESASFDDNGLAKNASWFYQAKGAVKNVADLCPNKSAAQCSNQQPGFDGPNFLKTVVPGLCTDTSLGSPSSWSNVYAKQGHTNWSSATFEGTIYFEDHSGTDDDYDMWLTGPKTASVPLTLENSFDLHGWTSYGAHVEFDSDETIDHFKTDWWTKWRNAVDNNISEAHRMVDGSDAVVVGLVGLDCVHDCISEIHPAYAVAMRVPDHPVGVDRWALFVRNSGDEGFCSQDEHVLETSTLILRLKAPPLADSFSLTNQDLKVNDQSVSIAYDHDGNDALFIVTLPNMNVTERLNGTIDLTWHFSKNTRQRNSNLGERGFAASQLLGRPGLHAIPARVKPRIGLEERLSAALAEMPAAQRKPVSLLAPAGDTIVRTAAALRPGAFAAFRRSRGRARPRDAVRLTQAISRRYLARLNFICGALPAARLFAIGLSSQNCSAIRAKSPARHVTPVRGRLGP
jgi:hypothetical protein